MGILARTWCGTAGHGEADAYVRDFRANVLPRLRKAPGLLAIELLCARRPERVEFLLVTRWLSMRSLEAYAGPGPTTVMSEEEEQELLTATAASVELYEVIDLEAARRCELAVATGRGVDSSRMPASQL
jgi:hypothetical protein